MSKKLVHNVAPNKKSYIFDYYTKHTFHGDKIPPKMKKSNSNLKLFFCTFIVLKASVTFKYIEGSFINETREGVLKLASDFYRNQNDIPLVIHFNVRFLII